MKVSVTFIEVGQGNCALVLDDSTDAAMLVDCPAVGVEKAVAYLDSKGINALEAVIVSHNDLDHLGGAYVLARRYRTSTLYWNYGAKAIPSDPARASQLRAALRGIRDLDEIGTTRLPIGRADQGSLGAAVKWEAYAPSDSQLIDAIAAGDANIASVVLMLKAAAWRFLIPGDAEAPSWRLMAELRPISTPMCSSFLTTEH